MPVTVFFKIGLQQSYKKEGKKCNILLFLYLNICMYKKTCWKAAGLLLDLCWITAGFGLKNGTL